MSKWTAYQLLVGVVFVVLITINNVFAIQIAKFFSFTETYIASSFLIIFFTVILVIWGFTTLLLLQEKKGKPLFTHKIWRIMPAISGGLFLLSVVAFLALFLTIFSDLSVEMRWVLDIIVIYFLALFYMMILSIVLRYGKADTSKGVIITSANTAVLILFAILFLGALV